MGKAKLATWACFDQLLTQKAVVIVSKYVEAANIMKKGNNYEKIKTEEQEKHLGQERD